MNFTVIMIFVIVVCAVALGIYFGIMKNKVSNKVVFAVIGDFGSGDANAQIVADMVNNWTDVQFIISLGDNNYDPTLSPSTYNERVCKYYGKWVKSDGNLCTAKKNAFFSTPGNHDTKVHQKMIGNRCISKGLDYSAYDEFFHWPGKERIHDSDYTDIDMYYDFTKTVGDATVQFYAFNANCLDADAHGCEDDTTDHGCSKSGNCNGSYTTMADNIKSTQVKSRADWSLVFLHQTPYSLEGDQPCAAIAALDFASDVYNNKRGHNISAILAGHSHNYQRFTSNTNNNVPFYVNGTGGTTLDGCPASCTNPKGTSSAGCSSQYGAMKITASKTQLVLEYYQFTNNESILLDRCTLTRDVSGRQQMRCTGPFTLCQ